ncbi:MAG: RsfS/YbeB/iojap family protein [bacterium]|nr:RsfS/YbeB/iojap family protein [bacterium]
MREKMLDEFIEDLKKMDAFNITVINTPDYLTDYFIIASVDNIITLKAIVDKFGGSNVKIHGEADSGWVILDFNDFWCHLFLPHTREYYNLERLWTIKATMRDSK